MNAEKKKNSGKRKVLKVGKKGERRGRKKKGEKRGRWKKEGREEGG